jgi:hypothetical protein
LRTELCVSGACSRRVWERGDDLLCLDFPTSANFTISFKQYLHHRVEILVHGEVLLGRSIVFFELAVSVVLAVRIILVEMPRVLEEGWAEVHALYSDFT